MGKVTLIAVLLVGGCAADGEPGDSGSSDAALACEAEQERRADLAEATIGEPADSGPWECVCNVGPSSAQQFALVREPCDWEPELDDRIDPMYREAEISRLIAKDAAALCEEAWGEACSCSFGACSRDTTNTCACSAP